MFRMEANINRSKFLVAACTNSPRARICQRGCHHLLVPVYMVKEEIKLPFISTDMTQMCVAVQASGRVCTYCSATPAVASTRLDRVVMRLLLRLWNTGLASLKFGNNAIMHLKFWSPCFWNLAMPWVLFLNFHLISESRPLGDLKLWTFISWILAMPWSDPLDR